MSGAAGRWTRRLVPPLALLLVLGAAGTAIANAANTPAQVQPALTAAFADGLPDAAPGLEPIAAPSPSAGGGGTNGGAAASEASAHFGPEIQVILPPPPPPPAATGGKGSKGHGGSGTSAGGSYPLLDAVNAARAAVGQPPLTWSQSLANGAAKWSSVMCSDEDAAIASGLTIEQGWATAFRHDGSFNGFSGENIYTAYGGNMSLSAAHNGWMNSPGHYANIVRAGFTKFGVAACTSANGVYFATERFDY